MSQILKALASEFDIFYTVTSYCPQTINTYVDFEIGLFSTKLIFAHLSILTTILHLHHVALFFTLLMATARFFVLK